MQHVTVYREAGRYAGWPANYGMWSWGNEMVVGFTLGYHQPSGPFHARDKSRPFVTMQGRSLDGGLTWQIEEMPCRSPGGRGLSADEHMRPELGARYALETGMENAPALCPGEIPFTHPDFALMCARTGLGAGTVAWFYFSTDRCRSWQGPFSLPMFGQAGVEARTDYLVSGPDECMLFLTASRESGGEGKGVFCVRTADASRSWQWVGWVAVAAAQGEDGFMIMPSSLRLPDGRILTAMRCRGGAAVGGGDWIDLYGSDDHGLTWHYQSRPAADTGYGGNPPACLQLADGRLCLIYGYRSHPGGARPGLRAALSGDGGLTWETHILRADGGSHDLGYARAVQRPDGTVVAVYYFNDRPEGEGYIAATLWRP